MDKYKVEQLKKQNHICYIIIHNNEDLELLPCKYLKYLDKANASHNTISKNAYSLTYYHHYMAEKSLTVDKVYNMSYRIQTQHFVGFLKWIKQGSHTAQTTEPLNKTCNMYLRDVFSYYRFLALEEYFDGYLKVLQLRMIFYNNRVGVKSERMTFYFKGFLKEEENDEIPITEEKIQILIDACTNNRDRLILCILAETGFRIGELLGIQHTSDIDYDKYTVQALLRDDNENEARAKNAEYRKALLRDDTFYLLSEYMVDNYKELEKSEFLFLKRSGKYKGQALEVQDIYSMFKRLEKKTGIKAHPHQFRHFFARERRKAGWDLVKIQNALGHKLISTTIKYLGEDNEALIEATEELFQNNKTLYNLKNYM